MRYNEDGMDDNGDYSDEENERRVRLAREKRRAESLPSEMAVLGLFGALPVVLSAVSGTTGGFYAGATVFVLYGLAKLFMPD